MEKIKVLLTRSSLEAHDRGVKYTAKKLVEAGIEVVYTPFGQVDEIIKTAEDEDVNLIGISCSATNSVYIVSALMKIMEENKVKMPVVVGGVIPNVDIPKLEKMGVKKVFGPGSDPRAIVEFVQDTVRKAS